MRLDRGDRSAAMQLGISTIVILVIAMVMIGAGISFIRTIFSSGQQVVEQSVPSSDLTINPTTEEPLAMSPADITEEAGGSATLQIGIYNNKNQALDFKINLSECRNRTDGPYEGFSLVSTKKTIERSQQGGYQLLFNLPADAATQSPFVCNVQATGRESSSDPVRFTANKDLIIRATG